MSSYEMVPMLPVTHSLLPSDRDPTSLLANTNQGRAPFSKVPPDCILNVTNSTMNHVLLLRAPSTDGQDDPYDSQFKTLGPTWTATSIQVLDTKFTGLEELQWIIQTGPKFHGYKGVILTSARSADAWKQAVETLVNSIGDIEVKADWSSIPFFVVGGSTASALQDHSPSHSATLYPSEFLGADSGTGEQLAQFILTNNTTSKKNKTKFLFLVGDKNRDVLPKALEAGGYELDALQVYETCGSPAFTSSLAQVVLSSPNVKTWWISFFAPSSSSFAIPHLRNHFELASVNGNSSASKKPVARIAAIGPTTANHLKDKLQLKVDAIAEKPKPQSLSEAIVATTG